MQRHFSGYPILDKAKVFSIMVSSYFKSEIDFLAAEHCRVSYKFIFFQQEELQ